MFIIYFDDIQNIILISKLCVVQCSTEKRIQHINPLTGHTFFLFSALRRQEFSGFRVMLVKKNHILGIIAYTLMK